MKQCPNCKEMISENAVVCPNCDVFIAMIQKPPTHSQRIDIAQLIETEETKESVSVPEEAVPAEAEETKESISVPEEAEPADIENIKAPMPTPAIVPANTYNPNGYCGNSISFVLLSLFVPLLAMFYAAGAMARGDKADAESFGALALGNIFLSVMLYVFGTTFI